MRSFKEKFIKRISILIFNFLNNGLKKSKKKMSHYLISKKISQTFFAFNSNLIHLKKLTLTQAKALHAPTIMKLKFKTC